MMFETNTILNRVATTTFLLIITVAILVRSLFFNSCEARYLTLAVDDKLLPPSGHKFSSFTCSFNGNLADFNTQIVFGV